jgi:hypothetical protein
MEPEGAALCGKAGPGGAVASSSFLLEPGYCYTFLGQSLPPIEEMDMRIETAPTTQAPNRARAETQVLLSAATRGERINIADGRGCYATTMALSEPVRLVLHNVRSTRDAAGPLAAQVLKQKLR